MPDSPRDHLPASFLERLFYLQPGELRTILPYFSLYFLLFLGLTLADGLSLALFVQKVGADRLPACYALTAVLNLFGIAAYLWWIRRVGSVRIFQAILLGSLTLHLGIWIIDRFWGPGESWYALLFVGREMSFTLVLMHFGTYLLDFFSREQLQRVLPIIYGGGRVGGIAGGIVLQTVPRLLEPIDMVLLIVGLFGIGILFLAVLRPPKPEAETIEPTEPAKQVEVSNAGSKEMATDEREHDLEQQAMSSIRGFLKFVWHDRLMFWTTVTSILYVICRWILNFQYSTQFEQHFSNAAEMTQFLGLYSQIALTASLLLQMTLVNRLVSWVGLKGSHLLYGLLLVGAFTGNLLSAAFAVAVFSRFVEAELRFGLRNPVAQMILNQFSKQVRVPARAWSLGFLIPGSTLATAVLLTKVPLYTGPQGVAWLGLFMGACYVGTSFRLYASFRDPASNHT